MPDDPSSPATPEQGDSPFVAFYQPPRLGIIHLLVWIAAAAALISRATAFRAVHEVPFRTDAASVEALAVWTIETVLLAASLVGAFLLLRDRFHSIVGDLQPGHWVMLAQCVLGLAAVVAHEAALAPSAADRGQADEPDVAVLAVLVAQFTAAGLYLKGAMRCPVDWLWRFLLALLAIGAVVTLAFVDDSLRPSLDKFCGNNIRPDARLARPSYLACVTIVFLLPLALLPIAVTRDVVARVRRDWLHWLGLALLVVAILRPVVSWAETAVSRGLH